MSSSVRYPMFRRAWFALACLLWLTGASLVLAGPAVRSVGTTVSDLDRSVAFYRDVLEFREVARDEVWGDSVERLTGVFGARVRTAELALGNESFVLTEYLTPRGRAVPEGAHSNDRWFQHIAIVVSDIDVAYARLREHGVQHVSTAPQTLPDWNPAAGGIRAFYFQDPDGHNLEIIWFPSGKGDPRWQQPDGRLFLGIDHTAIVVGDTEASLGFYRDLLGLHVAGFSENWGIEQERLNLVFGAHLRITGLRGDAGPGIEFLEYLTPRNGRSAPTDLAPNDLVHWQVTLGGTDVEAVLDRTANRGGRVVSAAVAGADAPVLGEVMIRDPDGHALVLTGFPAAARQARR